MDTFAITNGTRGALPRVPFSRIKEAVLGKRYTLSLVFIGNTRMRRMNRTYRGKDATTDILSFPFDRTSGEIVISLQEAAKRAKRFAMTPRQYLTFLMIHGCLHLNGFEHGSDMETHENKWCAYFNVPQPHG